MVSSEWAGSVATRPSTASANISREKRISGLPPILYRGEAEAAVRVAADLVDEIDFPGEVFAHKALAVSGSLARRQRDIVGLAEKRPHAGLERQTRGFPGGGPARQHFDRAAAGQLGRGIAGDRAVLAGQDQPARGREFV